MYNFGHRWETKQSVHMKNPWGKPAFPSGQHSEAAIGGDPNFPYHGNPHKVLLLIIAGGTYRLLESICNRSGGATFMII